MLLKTLLIDINEPVVCNVAVAGCISRVRAPLTQTGHFSRQIEFFLSFRLDDPDPAIRGTDNEIGGIRREVST